MKFTILLFFCFFSVDLYAQDMPSYLLDKVRIVQSDQTIVAELQPVSANITAKPNLHYYWYSANIIHETQGGFSGKLLDGLYTTYYPDKNLKEQGRFKKGLKNGLWKTWKEDGSLLSTIDWKHGIEMVGEKRPIWKRLPLIHKRRKPIDSLNNSSKQVKQ